MCPSTPQRAKLQAWVSVLRAANRNASMCKSATAVGYVKGFFRVMMRLFDVIQRPLLQPLRKAIVLFARDIVVGLVNQFKSAMQAAGPVESGVNRRVLVQVLAIINRSPLDLANGLVDLMDRPLFLFAQFPVVGALQMGSCVAQIGQSMQIGRMPILCKSAQSN